MTDSTTTSRHQIPGIGLGTLGNKGKDARDLVESALSLGYRHVDTAEYYGNEEAVGEAIGRTSVPRSEIWITTKVLHPKAPTPPDVRTAAEASLRRLRLDYVDALLIHWPNPNFAVDDALGVFLALRDEGKVRAIGVSNFPTAQLREALDVCDDVAINQVEYHPYLRQDAVLELAGRHDVTLIAHTPLMRGRLLDDPVLGTIAADHGCAVAQVALSWLLQQGVVAIPGGRPEQTGHLQENLGAMDVRLSGDEMARIDALASGVRVVDGPHAPQWDD